MDSTNAFDILSNAVRQAVVRELHREDGVLSLDEIASRLVDRQDITSIRDTEGATVQLLHVQLPRMMEFGAVDYDLRTGDVILTDVGDSVALLLEVVEGHLNDHLRNTLPS